LQIPNISLSHPNLRISYGILRKDFPHVDKNLNIPGGNFMHIALGHLKEDFQGRWGKEHAVARRTHDGRPNLMPYPSKRCQMPLNPEGFGINAPLPRENHRIQV
jgi:hypothetical protein